MTLTAPATANVGGDVAVDVHLSGPDAARVAGFQATALVDAAGGDVVAAIPALAGARILDAGATGGSATVGFFGGQPGSAPSDVVAHVLVTPKADGRLQVRLTRPILVDATGNVLKAAGGSDAVSIAVGSGQAVFHAPTAAEAGVTPAGRPKDRNGDGRITHADVAATVLDWESARATVADVQSQDDLAPAVPASASAARIFIATRTWVVNTTDDLPDANPGDGVCATAAPAHRCSLRAAISEANLRPGDDEIDFKIPGRAPQVIQLTGVLTAIDATDGSLKIDGYTQRGATENTSGTYDNAVVGVVLKGYSATDDKAVGLQITGGQNIITGLGFDSVGRSIHIYGPATSHNLIVGNVFGVTAAGTRESFIGHYASVMIDGSPSNVIGTPAVADRNLITGGFDGILIDNPGADGNVIQNNVIGASPDGSQPWGGQCTGIDFNVGPKNNAVGGPGRGARNAITAYGCDAIEFSHGRDQANPEDTSVKWQVNDNTVVGNYLGIRADGSFDPVFQVGLHHNENDSSAVNIWDFANHNTVTGNYMTAAWNAVRIAHDCNLNIVSDNSIGILPNGDPAPLGQNGVLVQANSSNEQILRNRIGNVALAGVAVSDYNDHFVTISRNTFTTVGTLGIDLGPLGTVNPNDFNDIDTGANYGLNFPVITTAKKSMLAGSGPANATIEVFLTRAAVGQNGPGRTYVASATSDGTGAWMLPVSLGRGDVVTATATDALGDTSEFGTNVKVGR